MSTTGHESEAIKVSGLKAALKKGGNKGIFNEAICSTAAATPAKVTNTAPPSFSLTGGAKIIVKFTYGISVANATLQVGDTAAKPIYYRGTALAAGIVKAGDRLLLGYNGTQWDVVGVLDQDLSGKADVSSTVSNVSYNSSTSKIQQTINGVTSDVCSIAQGGYQIIEDNTNGIDELTPVGGATITDDNENGLDVLTF